VPPSVLLDVARLSQGEPILSASTPAPAPSPGVTNPIIQAIAPNPSTVARKGDAITFTVVAFAPDGSPLQYTWAATKGTLSATVGQIVSWTPQKSDGTLESGLATIQVILTNGKGGIAQSAVNVTIAGDGGASVAPAPATPAPNVQAAPLVPVAPLYSPPVVMAGAKLVLDGFTFTSVPDRNHDGTHYDNGDKAIQRGETVLIVPTIKNVGTSRTDGVQLSAKLTEAQASFVDVASWLESSYQATGTLSMGSIEPGQSKTFDPPTGALAPVGTRNGFVLTVSSDCEAGRVFEPVITAADQYGNEWTMPLKITIQ
jgi:hypothetical protein